MNSIKKSKISFAGVCALGFVLFWACALLKAEPAGADKDNDAVEPTSTAGDDMDAAADQNNTQDAEDENSNSDELNFSYFLTSGYAANDLSAIPSVGKVAGTPELDGSLSTAKTLYVVLSNDQMRLEPGDKLIVFGDAGVLLEKHSGFNKRLIKNLAILKVRENEGKRYLTDVVASYDYIPAGSPVKLYSGERAVWDNAQVAKEPPTQPIKCYVAGGESTHESWNQSDYVILTAGSKQGVVEGLTFQLFEIPPGMDEKSDGIARGFVKVFYAGASYSIARIQEGSDSVLNGFEALYTP